MTNWLRKLDLYFGLFVLILLGALFLVFTRGTIIDSREDASKADLYTIAQVLEVYRKDHGDYPATEEMSTVLVKGENGKPAYLDRLPKDPWGQPYTYKRTSGAVHPFILYSTGANRADENGLGDDVDYWKTKDQIAPRG